MAWVKRLQLHKYWPLVVASGMLLLTVFYLLFDWLSPLDYPDWQDGTVVYPLLIFYEATAILLTILSLVGFCVVLIRSWDQHYLGYEGCGWVFIGLVAVIVLTAIAGWLGLALLIVLLLVTAIMLARTHPLLGWAALLMLLASVFSCVPALKTAFNHVSHQQSVQFDGNTYNLAFRRESDFDCNDHFYVVYQCDAPGLICQPIFTSEMYGECLGNTYQALPTSIIFRTDTSGANLNLVFDGETVYTVQATEAPSIQDNDA